ncbi:hypothetical protein [Legionella sp.]|uniref:hypothetical protein n=1 Tax=Legionella sp. TaxID=459 RepID=UPI003C9ECA73
MTHNTIHGSVGSLEMMKHVSKLSDHLKHLVAQPYHDLWLSALIDFLRHHNLHHIFRLDFHPNKHVVS